MPTTPSTGSSGATGTSSIGTGTSGSGTGVGAASNTTGTTGSGAGTSTAPVTSTPGTTPTTSTAPKTSKKKKGFDINKVIKGVSMVANTIKNNPEAIDATVGASKAVIGSIQKTLIPSIRDTKNQQQDQQTASSAAITVPSVNITSDQSTATASVPIIVAPVQNPDNDILFLQVDSLLSQIYSTTQSIRQNVANYTHQKQQFYINLSGVSAMNVNDELIQQQAEILAACSQIYTTLQTSNTIILKSIKQITTMMQLPAVIADARFDNYKDKISKIDVTAAKYDESEMASQLMVMVQLVVGLQKKLQMRNVMIVTVIILLLVCGGVVIIKLTGKKKRSGFVSKLLFEQQ